MSTVSLNSGVAAGSAYSAGFVSIGQNFQDDNQASAYLSSHPAVASPAYDVSFSPVVVQDGVYPIIPGAWVPNDAGAAWIGPNVHGQSNPALAPYVMNPNDGWTPATSSPQGVFYYSTTFNVAPGSNPHLVGGSLATDNTGMAVFLNGAWQNQANISQTGTMTPFTLNGADFVVGTNTLTFAFFNEQYSAGRTSPSGIRVKGTIVADDVTPSPAAFLQGTVFNDLNGDGHSNANEPYVAGATVQLYAASGMAPIGQLTTDGNGYYRFDGSNVAGGNLPPGDYRIVETPPNGYLAGSAQAITQLGSASVVSPTTIKATLIDPTNLTLTFDTFHTGLGVTIQANGNSQGTFAGGLGLTLKRGGTTIASLVSDCIDLFHSVGGGDTFAVLPRTTSDGFPAHGGRIAYLYNHYGMNPNTPAAQAAALQIALWELQCDTTVDLTSGVFSANGVDPAVFAAATAMLSESAGKNEAGIYLDATLGGQAVPHNGRQGMMAGGSFNFGNTRPSTVPTGSLAGRVYVDVNDDGRIGTTEPGLGGVVVVLSGVVDGGGVATYTTTTSRDGIYRFEHLHAGTYAISETPPVDLIDARDTLGNRGGTVGKKRFTGISLGQGIAGEGYNFGHERPPQFTTRPIVEVPLGATYIYQAGATDPDGDALRFSLASGLAGSTLNADTGKLAWTPTAADLGSHDVTLRVSDGRGGLAEQHYSLTVVTGVPNRPPIFTSDPVVDANVSTPYTYQATAFDPDFDALSFALVSGPAGLAIADPAIGLLRWTPAEDQLGRHEVVVSVSDGHGHTTYQPYSILVQPAVGNHPPVIVSEPTKIYRFPAYLPGSQIIGTATVRDFPSDHRNPDFEQGVATEVVSDLVDKQLGLLQVDAGSRRVNIAEVVDDGGMMWSYNDPDPFRDKLSFATAGNDWTMDWGAGYNYTQRRAAGQPGANTATWKIADLASGAFEVRATWTAASGLATDARYQVYDGDVLLATVPVDQTQAPAGPSFNNTAFQSLGTFKFASGTLRVVISSPTGGTIVADAVQVLPATNLSWGGFAAPGTAAAGSTITVNRTYVVAGPAPQADLVIAYYASPDATLGNGDDILLGSETVNSAVGKSTGSHAGTSPALRLPFSGGTYHLFARVDAGRSAVESSEADNAIEAAQTITATGPVVPAPSFVDNNGPGFTQTGYGWTTVNGGYNNAGYNFSVLTAPAGTGSNTVEWQTPNLPAGDYLVRTTWTQDTDRATNATYRIYDGSTLVKTVVVDQTKPALGPKFGQYDYGMGYSYGGALFQALGTVHVASGTLRVVLTDSANGTVVADAIRVEPSGPSNLNWVGGGVAGPLSAAPGSSLTVQRTYNVAGIAAPGDFSIGYYGSANGVLGDADDYLLGSEIITTAAGKSVGLHAGTSPVLRVPTDGGPVYIFVKLDAGAGVTEPDESDNVGSTRDRRPTYAGPKEGAIAGGAIHGIGSFNQWYRDTPGINRTIDVPLVLTETAPGSGTYGVVHDPYFPIDGLGFGNDIPAFAQHNFNFTVEFHGSFTYRGGEVFNSASDDDSWVFINNRLVIDAGGTHGPYGGDINLDNLNSGQNGKEPLGLVIGQSYPIDIFYAERQTGYSRFQVQTDIEMVPDRPYTYAVRAIDPDGDPITYTLLQAPMGMTIDPTTGLITWQPSRDQIGSHTVSVRASDGRGGFSEPQTYTLVVGNPAGNADPSFKAPFSPKRVHLGDTYTYQPNATDADGDPLTFSLAGGFPVGMTIDRYTGLVTWKPRPSDVNVDYLITIQASDGHGGLGTDQYHLKVDRINNSDPVIDPPAPPTVAAVGQLYTFQAHSRDAEGDLLSYDLPVGPDGMIVVPETGLILWVPSTDEVGPQDVILRVRDGLGGVATLSFRITVAPANLPPAVTSTPIFRSQAGRTYTYQVRAVDPDAGNTLTYRLADPHPPGMSINATTGLLTWPGSVVGTYRLTVSADDGLGGVGSQSYDLQVVDQTNHAPTITSTSRTTVQAGRTYRYQVIATDEDGDPLTYSLVAEGSNGPLPAGLSISPSGLVTWTPTANQLSSRPITSFHVLVDDQRYGTFDQLVTVHAVQQGTNQSPTISTSAPKYSVAGRGYLYPVQGSDPDGDPLFWSLDVHPDGMVIDPSSGMVAWLPTVNQVGTHPVTIRVNDDQGGFFTQSYNLTVRGEDLPPRFVLPLPTAATEHVAYSFQLHATDPEGEVLAFALEPIPGVTYPAGLSVSSSGVLSWTNPGPIGPIELAVRLGDEAGNVVIQGFTLQVVSAATNHPPKITSDPARGGAVGLTYHTTLTASDPDGDAPLGFSLKPGAFPAGMTLLGNVLSWTPTAATPAGSPVYVTVVVTDPSGAQGFQTFPITVIDDQAPTLSPIDNASIAVGQAFRVDAQASDPDHGDTLTFTLTGPSWLRVDAAGRMSGTPTATDRGLATFQLVATDFYGKSSPVRTFQVNVGDDVTAPTVVVALSESPINLGQSVTILVTASDNVGVTSVSLTVGGRAVTLDANGVATLTPDQAADLIVIATAADAAGHSTQATDTLRVIQPGAPALTSTLRLLRDPYENNPSLRDRLFGSAGGALIVTAPMDVVGTAADPLGQAVSYTLAYAPAESSDFTTIRSASSGVSDGVLGRFDPTMLPNGAYTIRLVVHRPGVADAVTEREVSVAGNLKLGNFHVSFTDLAIPVAGLPITITRTYDTLDAGKVADFGYGWTLSYGAPRLQVSYPANSVIGWNNYPSFTDGTKVYVTLANGDRQGFTFRPFPKSIDSLGLITFWHPNFVPDSPGAIKLVVPDALLTKVGDEYQSIADDGELHTYNPADPAYGGRYTLISVGTETETNVDANTGDLISMIDTNGNSLLFSPDGIVSNTGRMVSIERDGQNRIKRITDPRGHSINYTYDAGGNLATMTDRSGAATTSFTYHADPAHYLNQIIDTYSRVQLTATYKSDRRVDAITTPGGGRFASAIDLLTLTQSTTDGLGRTNTDRFDARGRLVESVDAEGHRTLTAYDANNHVTSQRLVVGQADTPTNGENNDIVTRYEYDDTGLLYRSFDALGKSTLTLHDASGMVTSITDPMGSTVLMSYSDNGKFSDGSVKPGNLLTTTDPNGQTATFGRTNSGRIASFSKGDASTSYGYNAYGDPTSIRSASTPTRTLDYDANGNLLSSSNDWTDPDTGVVQRPAISHKYDANDRIIETADRSGVTTFTYDLLGRKTSTTNAAGTTRWLFDAAGNAVEVQLPDGTVSNSVYDAQGQLIWQTDPHLPGRVAYGTYYTYDKIGQTTGTAYFGQVTISLQPLPDGSWKSLFVSSGQNPLRTTSASYNPDGSLSESIDPAGLVTEYEYDLAGRETSEVRIVNGQSYKTSFTYNDRGDTTSVTDPLGRVTFHRYNDAGQLERTLYPDDTTTSQTYDVRGAVLSATDQLGQRTDYAHDPNGNLTKVTLPEVYDPISNKAVRPVFASVYDGSNNLTSRTDPYGHTQTFGFDAFNRPTEWTLPAAGGDPEQTQISTFDPATGRLLSVTSFAGKITSYTYDGQGRVKTIRRYASSWDLQSNQPGETVTYTYDSYDASGRHESVNSSLTGTTDRLFDERDRLVRITSPQGTIDYAYEDATDRLRLTKTAATEIQYGYDQRGLLTSVSLIKKNGIVLSTPETTSYVYDAANQLTKATLPNGVVTTYSYDPMGRVRTVEQRNSSGGWLEGFVEIRDAKGRVTTEYQGRTAAAVQSGLAAGTAGTFARSTFAYDALDRLASEALYHDGEATPYFSASYTWDLAGNRVKTVSAGADGVIRTVQTSFDARNRASYEYEMSDEQFGGYGSYHYDADGNLTQEYRSGRSISYQYDLANRLLGTTVWADGTTTTSTYSYDTDGIRTGRTVTTSSGSGSTTTTESNLVDPLSPSGQPSVLETRSGGGALIASYVRGVMPIAENTPGSGHFYLLDGHGSVRHLIDASGNLSDSYTYDAFGNTIASSGSTPNTILYRGEEFDPTLRQYYLRARYYDPATGRFASMDPWSGSDSVPMGLNKYLYGNGDPVQNIDPSGWWSAGELLTTISIGALRATIEASGRKQQANQILASWLAKLAGDSMMLNYLTMEQQEPELRGYEAMAFSYTGYLSITAFRNVEKASRNLNVGSKLRDISAAAAMIYVTNQTARYFGFPVLIPIKQNGLPNFTGWLYPFGTSTGFIFMTGDRKLDRDAINLDAGYKFNPKHRLLLGGAYQWHHHEVPGVMMLLPQLIHRIGHFGGVFYYEIAYGEKYKDSTVRSKKK